MRTYTQLTQEQRYQIYALKKMGHKPSQIASCLGVHKSTLSRELRRNSGLRSYRPDPVPHRHKRTGSGSKPIKNDWSDPLKRSADAPLLKPGLWWKKNCAWIGALNRFQDGAKGTLMRKSAPNGSTITSMPTKAVVATCTNTCVARKSALNVMAVVRDAGKSPIRSVSRNAPQSLRNENELAIGKQIRALAKANGKRSRFGTPAGVRHLG